MASPAAPALRIVVVEDDGTIAHAVQSRLTAEGFDVRVAGDGPSGVRICAEFEPHLVVLDRLLPGFDGLEVCSARPGGPPGARPHADRSRRGNRPVGGAGGRRR